MLKYLNRRRWFIATTLAVATGIPVMAVAQLDHTRIIVPFPPGGSSDVIGRILAEAMAKSLNTPFIVENRGGAQGNIGIAAAAKAEPDGRTLVLASSSAFTVNPYLYSNLGFDPKGDLVPIIALGTVPIILTVNPSLPARTLSEFIQYVKSNPGKLNYSSAGAGSSMHLAAELFQRLTGTKMTHVPYVSGAQAVQDVVANHVQLVFHLLPAVSPQIRAGTLRPIALLAPERSSTMPQVPTTGEAGMPSLLADTPYFILGPKGIPASTIAKLNDVINDLLKTSSFRDRIVQLGVTPIGGKPEEVNSLITSESARWGDFLKGMEKK